MSISSKKYLMLWMYGNKESIQKLTAYVNCSSEHGGSEDSILVWRTVASLVISHVLLFSMARGPQYAIRQRFDQYVHLTPSGSI